MPSDFTLQACGRPEYAFQYAAADRAGRQNEGPGGTKGLPVGARSRGRFYRRLMTTHWCPACSIQSMTYANNNERTLIATFKDYETARRAMSELEANGVPSGSVHIDVSEKLNGGISAGYREQEVTHHSGFIGWWNSLFGNDDGDQERRRYEGILSGGQTILRVTVPANLTDHCVEILNRNGSVDVDKVSQQESTRTDFARTETVDRGPIEVVEEELQVGKRAVRRGGVRVYSHVVTEPVEQQINLRERAG